MTLPTLERFLTLSEASNRTKVAEAQLRAMIQAGRIKGAILPNGEIGVSETTLPTPPTKKEQLPEYKKHAHLQGVEIGIGEAAREYDLNLSTVSRWVKAGYIRVLRQEGQKVLIDQADVAYCSEIYHRNGGHGKWLFNKDGTPYAPKSKIEQITKYTIL